MWHIIHKVVSFEKEKTMSKQAKIIVTIEDEQFVFEASSITELNHQWEYNKDYYDIGSSDFKEAVIKDQNNKTIGYMSYNGKITKNRVTLDNFTTEPVVNIFTSNQ